ncbi:class F sortase [Micromonospora fluostatini]|uniref:class F sortase n=1 Tax=Micromonospora sp. JCM 30529 TaxID=3421643 RepID=UPI003D177674
MPPSPAPPSCAPPSGGHPGRSRPVGWAALLLVLAGALGAVLLAAGLAAPAPRPPGPAGPAAAAHDRPGPSLPALPRSAPVRVTIPAIGVRAEVVPVAADPAGQLEVPPLDRPTVAGWYRLGVSPGEPGNAVLVGHVDSRESGPAVFFRLGRLRPGDAVEVARADGRAVRFVVDGVASYPKDRFPSALVYGPGDTARLRLLTCGGRFDPARRDYLDNTVVFATRVG